MLLISFLIRYTAVTLDVSQHNLEIFAIHLQRLRLLPTVRQVF